MHFLLSIISVVYVLTTPILEDGSDDATIEQIMKRAKNVESSKETIEICFGGPKYMAEDASSRNSSLFVYTIHKMKLDEAIQVTCIIRTNHLLLKDFNTPLKHHKEELTLVELGSHLRNLRSPSWYNDRKGKTINQHDKTRLILTRRQKLLVGNVAKLVTLKWIAMVLMLATKPMVQAQKDDDVAWWVDSELNQFHAMSLVRDADMSIDGLILAFDMDMKVPIDVLKVPPIKSFDKYLSILKEMKDMWFSVLNRSLRVSERAESGFLRKFSEYRAWEVPSFDGLEPQPLLNSTSLDVSPGGVIGPEPPIKPHRPDSSRMKVEMFDDDWGLESKEVSLLGEELSLFDRPNKV
ncbi:hypothetical protein Tco_0877274 [Tanacetum coccineum]|uniref:Uncharacterized protein n=1 Tax=Tanacetum coccineum TaxID=301880 RepID=A0ABQ5BXV6_9ASTR